MINNSSQFFSERKILLLSMFGYFLLFIGTLDWYKFHFDLDGVAYMILARRVANQDFIRSINNLWSPLNNWIAAPFSSFTNFYPLIYKFINAVISIGIICMIYLNAKRFTQNSALISLVLLILPIILLSYTHIQLAGDLLQLLLFLIYFYLITTKGFFTSVRSNILAAIIMFLAYLAKSFSLPFFLMQYPGSYILFTWFNRDTYELKRLSKPLAYGLIVFSVLSLAWAYCLYIKYGKLMFSAAGTLNYNWMIGREKAVVEGSQFFIPPPYNDSPGFWEDPYLYYKTFIGPLSSFTFFIRTCKLVLTNIKTALWCLLDISFLSYTIIFFLLLTLYLRKTGAQTFKIVTLLWTSLIVIGGYLLIHVETRYYWPVAVLLLIGGVHLMECYLFPLIKKQFLKVVIALVFAFSFLLSPIYALKDLKGSGKKLYEAGYFLKKNNIKGKFSGNYTESNLHGWYLLLAYWSESNLYYLRKLNYTQEELLAGIRNSNLDFFIYTYTTELEKQLFLKGTVATAANKVLQLPNENKLVLLFSETK